MIFTSIKTIKLINENIGFILILLLLSITIFSTTLYNNNKKLINENYIDIINNIYFQKSVNQVFNNLIPKYKSINHKISSGETYDKILDKYFIQSKEILKIKKI